MMSAKSPKPGARLRELAEAFATVTASIARESLPAGAKKTGPSSEEALRNLIEFLEQRGSPDEVKSLLDWNRVSIDSLTEQMNRVQRQILAMMTVSDQVEKILVRRLQNQGALSGETWRAELKDSAPSIQKIDGKVFREKHPEFIVQLPGINEAMLMKALEEGRALEGITFGPKQELVFSVIKREQNEGQADRK